MKQQLLELIEAYADAKATGNQVLLRMATTAVQSFLAQVELNNAAPDISAPPEEEMSGCQEEA